MLICFLEEFCLCNQSEFFIMSFLFLYAMRDKPIRQLQLHMIAGSVFQRGNSYKQFRHDWLGNRQATSHSYLLLGARKSAAGNLGVPLQ